MSYIVEYTTLSGKKVAMVHKTHERIEEAIAQASSAIKNGNYRSYKIVEGHKILPAIDRERYQERKGLEGPFSTLSGKVVYYDPKEGSYYDPDTDMYMSYDEFRALDNDYRDMRDERDIPVKEADETKYGVIRYPDTAISYIKNNGNGWEHIYDKSYGFKGPVDKADLKHAKKIAKEKIPSRMLENTVNEISDETLKSYHQKAIKHGVEVGMGKTVTDKDGNTRYEKPSAEQEKLSNKRITGAAKAMNKVFARKKSANNEVKEAVAKIACTGCDEVSTAKAWQKNNGFCPKCKTSNQGVAESLNEISPDLAKQYTKAAKMDREFNDDDITRLAKSGQSTQDMHRRNSKRTKGISRAAKVINKQPTNEGISDDAHHMERDHEVQMARSDLYKTANYAIKLHAILKGISEEQGLEGWMQAKITKAADYLSSVYHALEYDQLERSQSEPIMPAESVDEARRTSYQAVRSAQSKERALKAQQDTRDNLKKHDNDEEKRWKQTSMDPDAARKEFGAANVRVKKGALRNGDDMVEILETTTAGGIATAPMPMGKVIKRKKK